jgi:hypothetical protein
MILIRHVSPVAEFFAKATTWLDPVSGDIARVTLKDPSAMVDAVPFITTDRLSMTRYVQLTPELWVSMSTPKSMLNVPLSSRWTWRLLRLPNEHVLLRVTGDLAAACAGRAPAAIAVTRVAGMMKEASRRLLMTVLLVLAGLSW